MLCFIYPRCMVDSVWHRAHLWNSPHSGYWSLPLRIIVSAADGRALSVAGVLLKTFELGGEPHFPCRVVQ